MLTAWYHLGTGRTMLVSLRAVLREAEMSFRAGLFSRNTNVFTLFWAPRSAFDCALAARGAQLGFGEPH